MEGLEIKIAIVTVFLILLILVASFLILEENEAGVLSKNLDLLLTQNTHIICIQYIRYNMTSLMTFNE